MILNIIETMLSDDIKISIEYNNDKFSSNDEELHEQMIRQYLKARMNDIAGVLTLAEHSIFLTMWNIDKDATIQKAELLKQYKRM